MIRAPRPGAFGVRLVALALGVAALQVLATTCGGRPEAPGRIILVSMDTVRADHVDGYAKAGTTPHLLAIAEQGVRLRDFYAASSYTMPSHMSLFTGLDPIEHGVYTDAARLAPEVPTLTEALAAAGYRTLGIHESSYVAGRFGFDRGFASYTAENRKAVVGAALPGIVKLIEVIGDERYFLFLHTYAAHYPYGGFDRYRREHPERGLPDERGIEALRRRHDADHDRRRDGRAPADVPRDVNALCTLYNQLAEAHAELLGCGDNFFPEGVQASPDGASDLAAVARSYDARIRMIDRALGEIRATLERLGQWRDTLFIVTSDHGEAFFEHGLYQHDYVPFDEVLKVPLVISYPALLGDGAGRVMEGLAWHLDLMPTVLGLAGIAAPEGLRGMDLTPVLRGEAAIPADRAIFPAVLRLAHRDPRPLRRVVLRGSQKYIAGDARFGDAEGLLFDRARDPRERRNLRTAQPEQAAAMAKLARAWEAGLVLHRPIHQDTKQPIAVSPEVRPPAAAISDAERARLRELGYLD